MNRKYKKAWVKKLLNPRTKQTFGIMEDSGGFLCVTGVARKISPKHLRSEHFKYSLFSTEMNSLGLTVYQKIALTVMNDTHGMPFPLLAGFINEYL